MAVDSPTIRNKLFAVTFCRSDIFPNPNPVSVIKLSRVQMATDIPGILYLIIKSVNDLFHLNFVLSSFASVFNVSSQEGPLLLQAWIRTTISKSPTHAFVLFRRNRVFRFFLMIICFDGC